MIECIECGRPADTENNSCNTLFEPLCEGCDRAHRCEECLEYVEHLDPETRLCSGCRAEMEKENEN